MDIVYSPLNVLIVSIIKRAECSAAIKTNGALTLLVKSPSYCDMLHLHILYYPLLNARS